MIYIFRKEMKKWKSVLWLVLVALAITSLSMVLFRRPEPGSEEIASVNGHGITFKYYRQVFNEIKMQIEVYKEYARSYGISVDWFLNLTGLNNPEKAALDKCIKEKLFDGQTDLYNIELNQDYFGEQLAKMIPQQLKDPAGNINIEAYKFYLNRLMTSVSEYEFRQEKEIKRNLLKDFVKQSLYIPETELKRLFFNQNYKKNFQIIEFPFNRFLKEAQQISPNESELKEFFNKNKELYRIPEKRKADYWVISTKKYAENIEIDEQAILNFYERNKSSLFRIPPKIKIQTILFELKDSDTPEMVSSILQKAKEVHKEVINKPKDFSKFIKNYKSRTLDFFERGTYDPKLETAAFRLTEKNDISEIVKTEKGYEIIQLVDRIPASNKPLEIVRDEIVSTLKAKKSLNKLKSDIERILYEYKTDKDAINKFVEKNDFKKVTTDFLTQKDSDGDKLINLLATKMFSENTKNKYGSFTYQADEILYVITKIQESKFPQFEEVKNSIEKDFHKDKAKSDLKNLIHKSKKELLENKTNLEDLSEKLNLKLIETGLISRKEDSKDLKIDAQIIDKAFILDDSFEVLSTKNIPNYYLVKLLGQEEFNIDDFLKNRSEVLNSELLKKANLYLDAFIASLMRIANIEKYRKLPKE
ncbi:hypothetical protein GF322_00675 [Candidatus Dependentiae bacterium]|nr:hypothetical protein [Candidatus Dependentiae bacterium]